jgi:hypothetical protein
VPADAAAAGIAGAASESQHYFSITIGEYACRKHGQAVPYLLELCLLLHALHAMGLLAVLTSFLVPELVCIC